MAAKTPATVRDRRGCEWDDFGNQFTLILVRADAKKVAEAVAAMTKGKVDAIADPHKTTEKYPNYSDMVFQHAGHAWSVWGARSDDGTKASKTLSKKLKTRAIVLSHEDTAGWSELRVFDNGENVETYTWGPGYSDEMETAAEELGEEFDGEMTPTDNGKPWDHRLSDDDDNLFLFRSSDRKIADKSALADEKRMMDDALRANDAWLPSWSHFPWGKAPRSQLDFAGVFVVRQK